MSRRSRVSRNTITNWLKTETETVVADVANDVRHLSHDPTVPAASGRPERAMPLRQPEIQALLPRQSPKPPK